MPKIGRTSTSFIISLALHGILVLVLGFYMAYTQSERFQAWVDATFFKPKAPPKPQIRKPVVKPVVKPTVPIEQTVAVEQVQITPRVTTALAIKTVSIRPQTVLEFSNQPIRIRAPINPNIPKVINPNVQVPQVVTHVNLPISSSPDAIAYEAPIVTGVAAGPAIGRSMLGGPIQAGVAVAEIKPAGLASLVLDMSAAFDGLGDMVSQIQLGEVEVAPLPKGEPGGRVVGRGKDIRGVLRLTRVRHRLSDWWADTSSLNALAQWLNEKTKIKTDLNVEGGALALTDSLIMKAPILFMTGHDPSLVRQRNLMRDGGGLATRLTEAENAALRKYLLEKQGLLVLDDCGVNAPAQAMVKIFLAMLRRAVPECPVERIPNDHPIYNNYYELGGPPIGFDIFWWGTRPPKRNYLEGLSHPENGKLIVLLSRRDYMCSMESVSLPTRSVHYSPGVYRFFTNVVVYSLTTGKIADYSQYIPEDTYAKQALPESAPQAAKIGATPKEE